MTTAQELYTRTATETRDAALARANATLNNLGKYYNGDATCTAQLGARVGDLRGTLDYLTTLLREAERAETQLELLRNLGSD